MRLFFLTNDSLYGDIQIDNLNKIVAVHKESLDKFQAAKLIQDKEIQELHDMVCILYLFFRFTQCVGHVVIFLLHYLLMFLQEGSE